MKYKHLAMIMGVMITATSVGSTATAFAADREVLAVRFQKNQREQMLVRAKKSR